LLEAFQDRLGGHDLDVVLVRGETQMSRPRQCLFRRLVVGDVNFGCIKVKFHISSFADLTGFIV